MTCTRKAVAVCALHSLIHSVSASVQVCALLTLVALGLRAYAMGSIAALGNDRDTVQRLLACEGPQMFICCYCGWWPHAMCSSELTTMAWPACMLLAVVRGSGCQRTVSACGRGHQADAIAFGVLTGVELPAVPHQASAAHAAVAVAAAAGVTAARQALMGAWPEFASASHRSNKQVGLHFCRSCRCCCTELRSRSLTDAAEV